MKKLTLLFLISIGSHAQTTTPGYILDGLLQTSRSNLTIPGYNIIVTGTITGPYGVKGILGLKSPNSYINITGNIASSPSLILSSSAGINFTGTGNGAIWNNGTNIAIKGVGLSLTTPGTGFNLAAGRTNDRMGTATLSSGTITISNNSITANTYIFFTLQSTSGTCVGIVTTSAISVGTSFTITSSNPTDNCLVKWKLIEGL